MIVITSKKDNRIIGVGSNVSYHSDSGNPILTQLDKTVMSFPKAQVNVHRVKNVPNIVEENEWSYNGFTFEPLVKEVFDNEAPEMQPPTPLDNPNEPVPPGYILTITPVVQDKVDEEEIPDSELIPDTEIIPDSE